MLIFSNEKTRERKREIVREINERKYTKKIEEERATHQQSPNAIDVRTYTFNGKVLSFFTCTADILYKDLLNT